MKRILLFLALALCWCCTQAQTTTPYVVPPPTPAAGTFQCIVPNENYTDVSTCQTAFLNYEQSHSGICFWQNYVVDDSYWTVAPKGFNNNTFDWNAQKYVLNSAYLSDLWHNSVLLPGSDPGCAGGVYSGPTFVGFIDPGAPPPNCQANSILDPATFHCYCPMLQGPMIPFGFIYTLPMDWNGVGCAVLGTPPVIIGPIASAAPAYFYQADPPFTNSAHFFTAISAMQTFTVTGTATIGADGGTATSALTPAPTIVDMTGAVLSTATNVPVTLPGSLAFTVDQWTVTAANLKIGQSLALLVSGNQTGVLPYTLYSVSADPQVSIVAPVAPPSCGTIANPCAQPTVNPNALQISTAGNGGRLTIYQGNLLGGTYTQHAFSSTLNPIMGDFSGVIQADLNGYYTSDAEALAAGGGWVITYMPWTLYGQSGAGVYSSVYRTYMPDESPHPVSIVPAVPAFDALGNPVMIPGCAGASCGTSSQPAMIQQWVPAPGVALLADGTPAAFQNQGSNAWSLNQSANNVIRPGKYLVYFTGAGCSGRGCGIKSGGYFYSYIPIWGTGLLTHYVAPPPTCGTPTTPQCND